MRTVKLIVMAMLIACITGTLANAGTQIMTNRSTTINAAVKNNTSRSISAAVKLTGYDDGGTVIGRLCKSVYLGSGRTTNVDLAWQAPNYTTGIYWSSKIEVGKKCPSTVVTTTDDDNDNDDNDDDHHH